jgi:hypothetical protein
VITRIIIINNAGNTATINTLELNIEFVGSQNIYKYIGKKVNILVMKFRTD